jgi:hypothetical protein
MKKNVEKIYSQELGNSEGTVCKVIYEEGFLT